MNYRHILLASAAAGVAIASPVSAQDADEEIRDDDIVVTRMLDEY